MSLSVIQRPLGFKMATTGFQCTVSSSSGTAIFSKTNPVGQHGLIDGDYVYIISNIENYGGFWYVDEVDVNTFKILPYVSGTAVNYLQNDTVTVYKVLLSHGYSAVHLPIVYKLLSTLWPTNSADTARTVSSISNDSGYCRLNLSGDIKATGTAQELEWVQVFGQNEGIYQILNYVSDTAITINFPYSAGVSFASSTVQYYYNNYHAIVRLYAGLKSTHYWASQKAYELILEKKEVPDADGIVTVNLNKYLKSAIEVFSNNLLLGTLPNDIDSFCQFYITFAEGYDYSNGYTLQTLEGSFTDDSGSFEGVAVNAALPFKNTYSGSMSDYLYTMYTDDMKFLTDFDNPVIWSGQWWEICWLNQYGSSVGFKIDRYYQDSLLSSSITSIPDFGVGVYRQRVQVTGSEDEIRVSLVYPYPGSYRVISEIKSIEVNTECTAQNLDLAWRNAYGGVDQWRFTLGKTNGIDVTAGDVLAKNIFATWPKSYGATGDTLAYQSKRMSTQTYVIRSQDLSDAQILDLRGILTSPFVQVVNSNQDRRTVIVDSGSFTVLEELNKQNSLSFKITFTDQIPAQSL